MQGLDYVTVKYVVSFELAVPMAIFPGMSPEEVMELEINRPHENKIRNVISHFYMYNGEELDLKVTVGEYIK